MDDPNDRLKRILESDSDVVAGGTPSDIANGTPTEENKEGIESEGFQKLSDEQKRVIRQLKVEDLIDVVGRLSGGCTLDEAVQGVREAHEARLKAAEADQYRTLTAPEDSPMTADGEVVDLPQHWTEDKASEQFKRVAVMSKSTPLRLTYDERKFLRLMESALEVSEYTDKIDIYAVGNKARRMAREIKQICAILSGLVVAHNYEDGQRLMKERDFMNNCQFFQSVFEVGRRYKILNPERMRDSYGKLLYLLMDSRKQDVQQLLEFDCVTPVLTVGGLLETKHKGKDLLSDPLIETAIKEIHSEGKSRTQIQKEIKEKEMAIKKLSHKYAGRVPKPTKSGLFGLRYPHFSRLWGASDDEEDDSESPMDDRELTVEEIETCLYSLGDHNTFLRYNRLPCDQMINLLKQEIHPQRPESTEFSLAIASGREGARLSHSHERQYVYALQSLTLWREVLHDMFLLWKFAEDDMLDSHNTYRLRDTGQGLHRVQGAMRLSRAMHAIIQRVQTKVGGWVGSSVVHLGDHNVPNALIFIDKYTQVPRILGPVVLCLSKIPELYESSQAMKRFIDDRFGSKDRLLRTILYDFFKHAFDGSGADNFFDAGSCIDGRLTSAWNWCSRIEKKSYFQVFLLTGFTGFDGSFK